MTVGSANGSVRALGYLGITTPDLDAWERFATDVVGTETIRRTEDGHDVLYLKIDERTWRLAVHEGPDEALAYVGWEVAGKHDLEALVDAVEATGATVKRVDASDARARGVVELVRFEDPAGTPLEAFYGHDYDFRFTSPLGMQFVTDPCGLGHVFISVTEFDECVDFYCSALGFKVSDFADLGPVHVTFLRCNPRHHSLALRDATSPVPPAAGGAPRLSHVMFEVTRQDDVGRALDRCGELGYALTRTIGRHSNDQMFSFYVKSPSDFDVEIGHGGLLIDDESWTPRRQIGDDYWGHHWATGRPGAPTPG